MTLKTHVPERTLRRRFAGWRVAHAWEPTIIVASRSVPSLIDHVKDQADDVEDYPEQDEFQHTTLEVDLGRLLFESLGACQAHLVFCGSRQNTTSITGVVI